MNTQQLILQLEEAIQKKRGGDFGLGGMLLSLLQHLSYFIHVICQFNFICFKSTHC